MKQLQLLFVLMVLSAQLNAQQIVSPASWFGFRPGDDRQLFNYSSLVSYLQQLDQQSDRVKMISIGRSPLGKEIYVLLISSPRNLDNLEELKEINRRLALDHEIPSQELDNIVNRGKVFVVATMSMHSTEVGPSQSVPLMAYELATTSDPHQLAWLDNTVVMLVPSHNPDGMDMVVDHYLKYRGTKFERSQMPGVYHKYIGHDNNRDFVMLTQDDTRAISRLFSHEWFPQVMVEKHQMGATGVRYFVPPPHDPIAENIDAGLLNWMGVFGASMMKRMTADSLKGVTQRYLFDDYWPGHTETCLWKNTIGMLTEAASVHLATPIFIEPQEIGVIGKGLGEYKKSINMPDPWPGGWWRLSDIVKYEISSMWGIVETASMNRERLLRFRHDLTAKMVEMGKTQAPFYYVLPPDQHDPGELAFLVRLLREHGVRTWVSSQDVRHGSMVFPKGSLVVPLAQPFRAFIKEVMEKQEFPVRRYVPGGEIIQPYDITSWSLPLHLGLECHEVNEPNATLALSLLEIEEYSLSQPKAGHVWGLALSPAHNSSYHFVFSLLSKGRTVFRSKEAFRLGERLLEAGTFIVEAGSYKGVDLPSDLLPLILTSKPDMQIIKLKNPVVGLVETWFHDMDAGWTRYIFDTYGISYRVIRPADLISGVPAGIDVLVLPSTSKNVLLEGRQGEGASAAPSNFPPGFARGMGKDGLNRLMQWVDQGGVVISWGASAALFEGNHSITSGGEKEEFRLPFRIVSEDLKKQGLYVPGTLMQLNLTDNQPLTFGAPQKLNVFSRGEPVFATSVPTLDMDRRVPGIYSKANPVVSGYAQKAELLEGKPAIVWMQKGRGQVVVMGFNPQFRGNTRASFKLLFNGLFLNQTNN